MPELFETPRGWVEKKPLACGQGHRLEANSHVVSTQVCGTHRGNHRTYFCNCGDVTYVPALGSGCRVLHGAAGVRNL